MTVTAASFKAAFPAFTSDTDYPIPMLTYQLSLAVKLHNADRWGELLDDGIMLWTAHMITLEQQSSAAAAAGQSAGAITGPLASASGDGLSYSRNVSAAVLDGEGHWNLTSYGLRWKQMARMMGAGGIQVGVPDPSDAYGGAWPGPLPGGW
jgi:hypothetical protein